jgi:hypothetical protein
MESEAGPHGDRAIGSTATFEGDVFHHAQTYNDLGRGQRDLSPAGRRLRP